MCVHVGARAGHLQIVVVENGKRNVAPDIAVCLVIDTHDQHRLDCVGEGGSSVTIEVEAVPGVVPHSR